MACILKPADDTKGVVVLTTPERDRLIRPNDLLRQQIEALKGRWLVGLHHNWHDHAFVYDPLFDFSMAGEDDLREVEGKRIPLIPLDACNFVPAPFAPRDRPPFWDILYIARAVGFKRLPEFLACMRTLCDQGRNYRALLISPMPPYHRSERSNVFYELRDVYEDMFSSEERRRFTLLDPTWGYPFPFDLETIAHFYRSSRVFVHFADDERRCRVAAYAWAVGLPVVGMSVVGSLMPATERRPPVFYEVSDFREFPDRIVEAIEMPLTGDTLAGRRYVHEADTIPALIAEIEKLLGKTLSQADRDRLPLRGLGIRLGRHHGISKGPNTVPMGLDRLIGVLAREDEAVRNTSSGDDPELELALMFPAPETKSLRLRVPRGRRD